MAENKKSFILYCDLIHTVEKLPIEKAGELFVHILKYVNDKDPKTDDLLLNIAFEPIKQTLKRDLKRYESKKQDRSIAGRMGNLKRYNPDLYDNVNSERITLEQAEELAKRRKTRKSENDVAKLAVNDSVSVSVSDIKKNKAKALDFDFDAYLDALNKTFGREFRVVNSETRRKLKSTLKEYTKQDIVNAIHNCKKAKFHKDNNYQYCTPEYFARKSTLEKWSDTTETKEPKIVV